MTVCRVGLREAVDEIMQYQFSHSREAMSALQRLVDAADDGAHEIERLRAELKKWHDFGRAMAAVGLNGLTVPVPNDSN